MAQKHDIQYVGQFYVHGSEAKLLARQEQQNKVKIMLPLERLKNVKGVYLDPVAIFGLAVAVFMAVTKVLGAINIGNAWDEYEGMRKYLTKPEAKNAERSVQYARG